MSDIDIAWALEEAAKLAESGQRPDDGDPFNAGWNAAGKDIATVIRDMARSYDGPEENACFLPPIGAE